MQIIFVETKLRFITEFRLMGLLLLKSLFPLLVM